MQGMRVKGLIIGVGDYGCRTKRAGFTVQGPKTRLRSGLQDRSLLIDGIAACAHAIFRSHPCVHLRRGLRFRGGYSSTLNPII